MTIAVTADELHVLVHSTAWHHGQYRNHFTAGSDSDSWPVLVGLVEKGLMTRGKPSELTGGMTTFRVSDAGFEFLRKALP
jgi:hypothetical protein